MDLRLYDTATRQKQPFRPLDPQNVRMYVCGPTVYDFAHIGNARPVIVFDVLYRVLRHLYGAGHVKYVRNITDVEDKISARAARDYPGLPLNDAIRKVTEQTERQFHEDVAALGALPPDVEPRATEHIAEMRQIIDRLVQGGFAYVAEDHVLFSPDAMNAANSVLPRYGTLSNRSLDEMIAGARVDVAPYKRGTTDFVLWKPSGPSDPGWPSPAGIKVPGRPGWHIECSAMAWKHLGEQFDIHGGGIDLVFPHHENEVAQSCCAFHMPRMASIWMHNGFLQVESTKMSKSLGNFVTIRELLATWPGDVLRLQMLMTHYRQPIDWTEIQSLRAIDELEQWANLLQERYNFANDKGPAIALVEALSDDLNTPDAITVLREMFSRATNGTLDAQLEFAAACKFLGFTNLGRPGVFEYGSVRAINVPGNISEFANGMKLIRASIANNSPDVVRVERESIERKGLVVDIDNRAKITLSSGDQEAIRQKVETLIADRKAARARKDFKESDRIRDELAKMGVVVKDGKDAAGNPVTTWEVAR